jgi:hypothetical protein
MRCSRNDEVLVPYAPLSPLKESKFAYVYARLVAFI